MLKSTSGIHSAGDGVIMSAEERAKKAEERRKSLFNAFDSNEAYVGRGYVMGDVT